MAESSGGTRRKILRRDETKKFEIRPRIGKNIRDKNVRFETLSRHDFLSKFLEEIALLNALFRQK